MAIKGVVALDHGCHVSKNCFLMWGIEIGPDWPAWNGLPLVF
jgi:hypothetical protein